eukprot:6203941-Pleurochrysis_carterae.AAC.4
MGVREGRKVDWACAARMEEVRLKGTRQMGKGKGRTREGRGETMRRGQGEEGPTGAKARRTRASERGARAGRGSATQRARSGRSLLCVVPGHVHDWVVETISNARAWTLRCDRGHGDDDHDGSGDADDCEDTQIARRQKGLA